MTYFLSFSEHTWMTDPGSDDPDERWGDRPSYGLAVHLIDLALTERRGRWEYVKIEQGSYDAIYGVEEVPVNEFAYVVVVEYTDGDTLGHSGYWTCPGIFASREAADEALAKANGTRPDDKFRPWDGCFAHINDAWIEPMRVQP